MQNEFLGDPLKITNMVNPDKNIAFRMSREYLDRFVLACGETYVGLLRDTDNMPETFCDVHNIDEWQWAVIDRSVVGLTVGRWV